MRNPGKERASLVARHDFDSLSISSEIEVRVARSSEISALAGMAHRLGRGVQITEPSLRRYFVFDPECILTFRRHERLLGAIAFLYLNSRGHDALLLAEISLAHQDIGLSAGSN